jgi:EAL domain-containing protein (putative c-di-GMP-specific phosphodiesterase class I)
LTDAQSKLPLLAALGVTIAVDGYGLGRSSLFELAELPIHTLKLHESLLNEVHTGRRRAALSALIGAATDLGWSVVVKCVETLEQLEIARSLGCPRAQGRFWGATVRTPSFVSAARYRS